MSKIAESILPNVNESVSLRKMSFILLKASKGRGEKPDGLTNSARRFEVMHAANSVSGVCNYRTGEMFFFFVHLMYLWCTAVPHKESIWSLQMLFIWVHSPTCSPLQHIQRTREQLLWPIDSTTRTWFQFVCVPPMQPNHLNHKETGKYLITIGLTEILIVVFPLSSAIMLKLCATVQQTGCFYPRLDLEQYSFQVVFISRFYQAQLRRQTKRFHEIWKTER